MLEVVLTPTILGPHEIGGPKLDYRKKQTRTMRIRENINLTNDDVMKYIIGTLQ